MSSFFRRSNPIDPVKEIIAEELMILPRMFEETGDVCGQITHRNVLCRKLTVYFVSRTLMRFIIKGISVRCIAYIEDPVRGATVHFDSWAPGLDINGRYLSREEKRKIASER